MNQVAHRLPTHAADLGRFSPILAVADGPSVKASAGSD